MIAVLSAFDLGGLGVFAFIVLYALRFGTRRLEVRLGALHATVEDVNRAVNHKPEGEPTLYEHAKAANTAADRAASLFAEFVVYQHERNADMDKEMVHQKGRSLAMEVKLDGYVAKQHEMKSSLDRLEAGAAVIASDLAASHARADAVGEGEAGEAADAGSRSE